MSSKQIEKNVAYGMQGLNSVSFKRDMKPAEMDQIGIYSLGQVSCLLGGTTALSHATATVPEASFFACSCGLNPAFDDIPIASNEPAEKQRFGQNYFLDRVN